MAATPFSLPTTKATLEALLRERRLRVETPPLRGEDRLGRIPTGLAEVDLLLGGGFPRGRLSEIRGPVSSGRTGLLLCLLARTTRAGALAALVDPLDRFDPTSAAHAGLALARLLWLRGGRGEGEAPRPNALARATAAVATLAGSGLFDVVVLDLAGAPDREQRWLPATTWIRLRRTVENTETALLLVADRHVASGFGGASLTLVGTGPRWSAPPGPGRRLAGLAARVSVGRHVLRSAELAFAAFA
jgi:recombination protein RecA